MSKLAVTDSGIGYVISTDVSIATGKIAVVKTPRKALQAPKLIRLSLFSAASENQDMQSVVPKIGMSKIVLCDRYLSARRPKNAAAGNGGRAK